MTRGCCARRIGVLVLLAAAALGRMEVAQPSAHAGGLQLSAASATQPVTVTAVSLTVSGWTAAPGTYQRADGTTAPVLHITMTSGTFVGWHATLGGTPVVTWVDGSAGGVVATTAVIEADSITVGGVTYDATNPPPATLFTDGSGATDDVTIAAELLSATRVASPALHVTATS